MRPPNQWHHRIDGQKLKTATFKYLGTLVTTDGNTILDIWARTIAAWLKWRQVTRVLCDTKITEYFKKT